MPLALLPGAARPAVALAMALVTALAASVGAAPGARADVSPPVAAPAPVDPAASWTPPPEPTLQPIARKPCPSTPSPGSATCLSQVEGQVPDASAASAARADAVASAGSAEVPLAPQALPDPVTKTGAYSPADLASLYRIPPGLTSDATVAIIDAGSDPNTAAQLAYYRSYFGLPPCTVANGCFREVAQNGSATLPPTDSGWVVEIAMDVQAVSAICPTCHILLVDARSARSSDLGAAAQTAVRLGASYISMSYGAPDGSQNATLNATYYNATGVTYVAASGDSGYAGGTMFPSTAGNVVAAGGTSASLVAGRWQQSAWSGASSGCSQVGLLGAISGLVQSLLSGSSCPQGRAVTDLSALADAETGMLFYLGGAWYNGGGTSLAAPILTALYALAGNHTDPLVVYRNASARPGAFVDIASGSNGTCGTALCTAGAGWDGPTGIGTPAGLAGLQAGGSTDVAPMTRSTTASTLSRSGTYPATLAYRLVDATTGAPVGGALVQVQADTGQGFVTVGTAHTASDGTVRYDVRPHGPTSYRVLYGGDLSHAASISPPARVTGFTPTVRLRRAPGGVRVVAQAPWGASARVPVTVQRRAGAHWRTVRRVQTSATGVARVGVRSAHRTAYRATYGGDGTWAAGRTAPLVVRR